MCLQLKSNLSHYVMKRFKPHKTKSKIDHVKHFCYSIRKLLHDQFFIRKKKFDAHTNKRGKHTKMCFYFCYQAKSSAKIWQMPWKSGQSFVCSREFVGMVFRSIFGSHLCWICVKMSKCDSFLLSHTIQT